MKKIFILAVIIFISLCAFTQSNYSNESSTINTNRTFVRIIGNPARGSIIIQINNANSEKYDLSLYSLNGQKITSLSFNHTGGVSIKKLYVPAGVSGMNFLVVTTIDRKQSIKVFIQ